jgi:hypothetical protein
VGNSIPKKINIRGRKIKKAKIKLTRRLRRVRRHVLSSLVPPDARLEPVAFVVVEWCCGVVVPTCPF